MYSTQAWAKDAADSDFRRIEIQRNICGAEDVSFAVKAADTNGFRVRQNIRG